jgi:hypothetical protein
MIVCHVHECELTDRPSDGAIVERALSLANEAMFTIELQRRRLRSDEPEDRVFFFRRGADFQFLVVALRRLRRAAELACKLDRIAPDVRIALAAFDLDLPMLLTMRNVGEHVDDYAADAPWRKHKAITRRHRQVGSWDGRTFSWLGMPIEHGYCTGDARRLTSAMRVSAKGQRNHNVDSLDLPRILR